MDRIVIELGQAIVGSYALTRDKIEIPGHPVQCGELEVRRRSLGQEGKIPFVKQFVVAHAPGTGKSIQVTGVRDQGLYLPVQSAAAKGFELLPIPNVGL